MPLCYQKKLKSGQWVILWHITEPLSFFLSEGLVHVHRDKSAEAYALGRHPYDRRLLFYASRYVLGYLSRQANAFFWGIQKALDRIPYTKGIPQQSPWISLSHTAFYVAASLHPTSAVGIDIEPISHSAYRVRHRFLHVDEAEDLDALSDADATLYWSAKEAAYKALQTPSLSFQKDLRIVAHRPDQKCLFIQHPKGDAPLRIPYELHHKLVLTHCLHQA